MRLVGTIAEDLRLLQYAEKLGKLGGRPDGRVRGPMVAAGMDPSVERARLPGHDTAGRGRWSGQNGELLSRVASGDEAAFERLYERLADRVSRFALTIVRDRHLAQEVLQDTMVAVWKGAGRFADCSQVSTWVLGIARNRTYDLLRRETRGARRTEEGVMQPDPLAGVEHVEAVRGAVERLPPGEREVAFLTFYEGLSYREIAGMLGIPEGTVKSRMFHAKRRLLGALR